MAMLGLTLSSSASEQKVWQIGKFNHSAAEFKTDRDYPYADPKLDPVYRVGVSKDSEHWVRFHPGPSNSMTGGREHPYTILFTLPQAPVGTYKLRIAAMYETPRLSFLRVDVNGRSGLFYFHPKLDYRAGEWAGTFVPQTGADEKIIEIPAEWLKQGENKIVLTALDDPSEAENSLGAIAPGHSGIVYDALELTNDRAGRYDNARISVTAEPTIFYKQTERGLAQVVDVFAGFGSAPPRATVELKAGENAARQEITGNYAFGERRVSLEVPEWTGTVQGEVKLIADGREQRFPVNLIAGKKWTVFIVPHAHLDIGFTDFAAKVAELQSQSVDDAMTAMKRVPEFRWSLDGSWIAEQYLAGRSPERQQEFLKHLRDKRVILPLQYSNQHTGTATLEGLARSLYDAHQFAKKNNIPIDSVYTVDVPAYTWSYASVLKEAGMKYFLGASNNWRAPILLLGRWNERSPFWWEGPDGSRILMWYSRAYLQLHTMFGGPPRIAAARDSLPVFLQAYSRPDYKASSVIMFGSQLENTTFSQEQVEFPREWHKQYAWPKLQFASVGEAMSAIDKEAGGEFPVVRGDWGPYWEDGFGSDTLYTARHRRNQWRIGNAEKIGAIPTLLDPGLRPDNRLLREAWRNLLLFDEHTWTFVGATTQPESEQSVIQTEMKRARATEAERQIAESIQRSWAQINGLISVKDASIAVFNSLNWPRGGVVEFDIPTGSTVVDSTTGKDVPFETVFVGRGTPLPGFGGGNQRVRVYVDSVPALGYKILTIKSGSSISAAAAAQAKSGNIFESQFYRVTIDPASGALKSVVDKQVSRELVDARSPYRFGAYVYVTGADNMPNNSLYRFGAALEPPPLKANVASGGKLIGVRETPFATIIELESRAVNTPTIRTEIALFRNVKKIEFTYTVKKERVLSKESAYFAFPFAASKPRFAYGNQTGWVDPGRDKLKGASREWHTVMHWASVSDDNFSAAVIPQDAPLMTFGDIVRGNWPEEFKPASGAIFSWIANNYWGTNFVSWQGGEWRYRYVLTSGRTLDPVVLEHLGRDEMTPLEVTQLTPSPLPTRLPVTATSFLSLSGADIAISTWKLAEDGNGSILRLQELAGKPGTVRISSDLLDIREAWQCSLLEENKSRLDAASGELQVPVRPFEVLTLRLVSGPKAKAAGAQQ